MLTIFLFLIILFGSCGYAAIAGHTAGRLTAVLLIAASFLTPMLDTAMTWKSTVFSALTADIFVFLLLWLLAINFNRWWLIWCAGLQLASVLIHAATFVSIIFEPLVYQFFAEFWSIPILLVMAIGILQDNRALELK